MVEWGCGEKGGSVGQLTDIELKVTQLLAGHMESELNQKSRQIFTVQCEPVRIAIIHMPAYVFICIYLCLDYLCEKWAWAVGSATFAMFSIRLRNVRAWMCVCV